MLGKDLKKIREDLGLSQGALAKELGVSVRQIVNLENGKTPIRELYIEKISILKETISSTKSPKIIIPNQINSHISNIEIEILEAYRELSKVDQEIFYFKIKGAAAEARKKAEESNRVSVEDVKSVG